MQPHHCVPLNGRADFTCSVLVRMCLLCLRLRLKFGIFVAAWETSFAVTGKHCCRCFAQWFLPVLFSGVPYMPLLDYVMETAGVSLLHVQFSVNGISGDSTVSLMVLFSCRGVSYSNQVCSGKVGRMMV